MSQDNAVFEEIKPQWMKWEKEGDMIEGVLVGKQITQDSLSDTPKEQEVYIIRKANGEIWNVAGRTVSKNQRGGVPLKVILGMDRIALGQVVRIAYTKTIKAVKKGMNDTKITTVYAGKQADGRPLMDMAALNEYRGVTVEVDADGMPLGNHVEEVKVEDIPL